MVAEKDAARKRLCDWSTVLGRLLRAENRLHPAADAGGDGFLRRTLSLADAFRRSLDRVGGPKRLDSLGYFGNARKRLGGRLRSRSGEAGLELVAKRGELGQVLLME